MPQQFNPNYTIYKPNLKDSSKGCASSWEYNPNTKMFFLKLAKQNETKNDAGNPTFDWKNGRTIKLNEVELAEIRLVLQERKECLGKSGDKGGSGLYHQTKDGNCVIKLYPFAQRDIFVLSISSKLNNELFRVGHSITKAEAEHLSILIFHVIGKMFLD